MPVLPKIYQGPACVVFNGLTIFVKDGIEDALQRATHKTESDAHGVIDETHTSAKHVLSLTPVGNLVQGDFAKLFPYAPSAIGKRLFNPASAADKPLVIHTYEDNLTITYPRAALTKSPGLILGPNAQPFTAMEFTCLGDSTKEQTETGFWKTIAGSGTWPATFAGNTIKKALYTAAWGAVSPYDEMSAIDGFKVDMSYGVDEIPADDIGIADMVLKSIEVKCGFTPANLEPEEIETLLALEGEDAVLPGQSLAKEGNTLTLDSDALTVAILNCGPRATGSVFKSGAHRFKEIEFVHARTFTGGAGIVPITFTVK